MDHVRDINASTYESIYAQYRTQLRASPAELLYSAVTDYNVANGNMSYVVAVVLASTAGRFTLDTRLGDDGGTMLRELIVARRYHGHMMLDYIDRLVVHLATSPHIRRIVLIGAAELARLLQKEHCKVVRQLPQASAVGDNDSGAYGDMMPQEANVLVMACTDYDIDRLTEQYALKRVSLIMVYHYKPRDRDDPDDIEYWIYKDCDTAHTFIARKAPLYNVV